MSNKLDTKSKILLKSVQLFNEKGTNNVTTNHISKELGISPGNLYYHFRNKEEIIREIYEEMILEFSKIWKFIETGKGLKNIWTGIVSLLVLFHKYRFFMNDIVGLLKNDEILKTRYLVIKEIRLEQLRDLFLLMRKEKLIMLEINNEEIRELSDILWFTGDFWLMRNEFKKEKVHNLTKEDLKSYLRTNYIICKSYFTKEGFKMLSIDETIKKIEEGKFL